MNTFLRTYPEVLDYFKKRDFKTCAFDTEGTSLNYYDFEITGCSFANGESACYINLNCMSKNDRGRTINYIREMFRSHIKAVAMHNAPFDLKVLHKIDITELTDNIFCTMTAHHLINENANHGLKPLAEKYLGVTPVSFENASVRGFDSPEFLEYACNDAVWTFELMKIFNKKLYDLGMNRLFFEVEMPFQFTIMDLEINGVLVNEEKLEALRIKATKTHFKFKKQLFEMNNWGYSMQPNLLDGDVEMVSKHCLSDDAVRKILKKRGLKSPYLTKGGKDGLNKVMSVGAETLVHLKGDEFVDLYAKFKIVDHLLGSFVLKMPGHLDPDGRVRASYWNTGTGTGRLSSSKPNMQQNPKIREELPFDFKEIFEAPDGKVLLSVDYSGQELRGLGIVSHDPVLMDAFKNGYDLHLMTANAIFDLGIPKEHLKETYKGYEKLKKKYKYQRHVGKNGINFPIIYGTTAYGIAKNVGLSEDEAQAAIDKFFALYPGVQQAIKRCSDFLWDNWHVRSLTKRRRRIDPNIKKSHRQAFNFLIQSLGADMIRCACNRVREQIKLHPEWGIKIIMIIHDEIVMEINESAVEDAKPIIRDVMENAMPKLPIKMPVDIGVAKNFSGAH